MTTAVVAAELAVAACLAFGVVDSATTLQVCPTPQPCHCIGAPGSNRGGTVACSFLRLNSVPYFLEFDIDAWNELDLSENLLESLPPRALEGVRVEILRLNRNTIRTIDDAAFYAMGPEVELIDLSHNRLTDIRLGAVFHYLPNLNALHLRYNHLVRITAFSDDYNIERKLQLSALVELDLTGNDLDRVPTESLTSLPALRRLVLRDNRIRHVGEAAFAGVGQLEMVDLGANRAGPAASQDRKMMIDPRAFCGLEPRAITRQPGVTDWTGVESLRLDHNGLVTFDACSLVGVWTLAELKLAGNPLHCDCRLLRSLQRLTQSVGGFRLDPSATGDAQCATPNALAGLSLREAVYASECDVKRDSAKRRGDGASLCLRPCGTALPLKSSTSAFGLASSSSSPRCVCSASSVYCLFSAVTSLYCFFRLDQFCLQESEMNRTHCSHLSSMFVMLIVMLIGE